ncbi:MAG: Gfo/Idh/MocA family oxidoreductase [Planctomycetota bacterium]
MTQSFNHPTRRQVLAGLTAAAALGPVMLTGRSWARASANDKMGAVLIGAGKRGADRLLGQFLNHPKLKLLAIAEVDTDRREHYTALANKHYGGEACVGVNDYRDILDRNDIDIALIFTPDHWHTIPAVHAMEKGMHVYAEKPLTLNLLESQRIIEAQKKSGVTFQTGSQQRSEFGGRFLKAAEYVVNGRLGKCNFAEVGCGDPAIPCDLPTEDKPAGLDWGLWLGPAPMRGYHPALSPRGVHKNFPAFRRYEEYAGGQLADFGAHMFDIAQWAFGKDRESPVTVTPPKEEGAKRGVEMTYADGTKMVHASIGNGVRFIGQKGTLHATRGSLKSEPASILQEPLTDSDTRLHTPMNHLNNFTDCIGTDTQPVCDAEVGARTAALCHLANIAYDVKQDELKFDGEAWKFTNSEAANARLDYAERRKGFELPMVE